MIGEHVSVHFLPGVMFLELVINFLEGLWQADPAIEIIVALCFVKERRAIVTSNEE